MVKTHFNVYLDTSGVEMADGTPAIVLAFSDRETDDIDIYPVPLDQMENMSLELLDLVKVMKEKYPE